MRIVNPNADQPQAKSAFVTAVAVLFMALSAFGLLVGLQYFLFGSKYEGPEIVDNLAKSGFKRDWLTPDSLKSISRTIQSVSFILNSICLLAAYSLYRRMAWSRVFYMVYCTLVIIRDVVGIALVLIGLNMGQWLSEGENTTHMASMLTRLIIGLLILNALFYLFCLFKLSSQKIKREFQPAWMR